MCKQANKTAASIMAALEPELKSLLSFAGQLNTPKGQAAIAAYEAAMQAVANWTPGTTASEVMQIVIAFQTAFQAVVPLLPASTGVLVNIILASIVAVLGILKGNSPAAPAPAGVHGLASMEEIQGAHAIETAMETTAEVQRLVPEFKRSYFHSAAHQQKETWNKGVESGGFPESMKV